MSITKIVARFTILLLLIGFLCCKGDAALDPQRYLGDWTVVKAERDDRQTRTIDGALIRITEDQIVSDLLIENGASSYTLRGSSLHTPDGTFHLDPQSSDSLGLRFELQGADFSLWMVRAENPETH